MIRVLRIAVMTLACMAMVPALAFAQASLTGVVRDTSGAVLPGVTVEAASPVLIEKVRSAVTDGTGRYRIEQLRPGAYTVTFTLPGFATVKQDGVQLSGALVVTLNADLRVGALEETVTVTGETPQVDVQSTVNERVMNREIIDNLPSGKVPSRLAALIPGVTTSAQDVGGLQGDGSARGDTTVHGVGDARMVVNGMSTFTTSGSRGAQGLYNMSAFSEMAVDTGGIGAEQPEGGVRINLIPKDGGNKFETYFFAVYANSSMQGNNFTDELKTAGLNTPDRLNEFVEVNPAVGGPLMRDKLWFHTTGRYNSTKNFVAVFHNKNAGNPNAWTYEPDTSIDPGGNNFTIKNETTRLTWQATPKHKIAATWDESSNCDCPRGLTPVRSPEANASSFITVYPKRQLSADYSAPLTSRLLVEGGIYNHHSYTARARINPYFDPSPIPLIQVMEQSTGLTYRGTPTTTENVNDTRFARATASYITGAHSAKIGVQYGSGRQDQYTRPIDYPMAFRFNNGVPNRLTLSAPNFHAIFNMAAAHGVFGQDRWTVGRMTLTGGLRYDYFHVDFPETPVGPTLFAPNRNFVFPATDGVRWHNISPRLGLAYDLFGTGKTALKASVGRYLAGQIGQTSISSGTFANEQIPSNLMVTTTTRSWNDANRNFVPDCDLLNPVSNGECGAMADPAFGTTRAGTTYDPETLTGWQKGEYNWQYSIGGQHQFLPRMSVDAAFFRTVFKNLLAIDDRAVSPADFDRFTINAPVDPRLPNGGGYSVGPLYDLKPGSFGRPTNNLITFADNYGKRIETWTGFDVNFNVRPLDNLTVQGGTSTGRRVSDNCDLLAKLPEMGPLNAPYCHQVEKFLTQVKLFSSYTIPRVDVLLSATLQNLPGPIASGLFVSGITADYTATNAVVAPSLGRNLSGGANVVVNLVEPGTLYLPRVNQLDLRVGKILRFGRARTTASVDIYNLLNSDAPVVLVNTAYATWQRPQGILQARFAKVNFQVDF